jgi:hypothetical protein
MTIFAPSGPRPVIGARNRDIPEGAARGAPSQSPVPHIIECSGRSTAFRVAESSRAVSAWQLPTVRKTQLAHPVRGHESPPRWRLSTQDNARQYL